MALFLTGKPDQVPRTLTDIVGKEILPFSIIQDAEVSLTLHDDTDVIYPAKLGVLQVEKVYGEDLLMGNIIADGRLLIIFFNQIQCRKY